MARPRMLAEERYYNVTEMTERHHEILRMIVLGKENSEIAARLNITPQTVSDLRRSPIAQDYLNVLQIARDAETAEVSGIIARGQPVAAKLLERVINRKEEDAGIALIVKTAQDFLSRGGNSPIQKTQVESSHHISPDTIELIKQRRAEADIARKQSEQENVA